MIIKNASVFQEDGTFKTQDIYIEGDKIAENGSGDVLDADGLIAIPGLTDIHFHGCMRNDFCDQHHPRPSRPWLTTSFPWVSPPSAPLR